MKLNYLIKSIPFISLLITIIFLNISNQKQYTKLKILFWDTPSLSIGKYIAISSGSGFIISYIITNKLAKRKETKLNKVIKSTYISPKEEPKEFNDLSNKASYNNTLIERDIKDPSPTIKANFRIISKNNTKIVSDQNNDREDYFYSSHEDENQTQYNTNGIKYRNYSEDKQILNDWDDDSFSSW